MAGALLVRAGGDQRRLTVTHHREVRKVQVPPSCDLRRRIPGLVLSDVRAPSNRADATTGWKAQRSGLLLPQHREDLWKANAVLARPDC